MKSILLLSAFFGLASHAQAADVLQNCFTGRNAQFFASELESIAQDKDEALMLLNEQGLVVGVVAVTPERAAKHPFTTKEVAVKKIRLCSSLETDSFYYADDDLLSWPGSTVTISQDEGQILLTTTVDKKESYATKLKVDFKAYDVFTEPEDVEKQRGQPDFEEDWGVPKGKGTFYLFLPKNWVIKK